MNIPDDKSVRSRSSLGVFWAIVGAAGQQISALMIFIVLARLLNPSDFGLLALAAVFVDILAVLSRCGITELIMRHPALDDVAKSTAFWLSAIIGLFFTLVLYFLSGPISVLFSAPGLDEILKYTSVIAFLTALGSVHEGLLRRDFSYKAIAVRTFFSNIVSGVIAVLLALYGFGVLSLVFQRVISVVLSSYIMYRYLPWLPRFSFSMAEARNFISSGLPFASANILAMSNQRIIDIFVGYTLGATDLGYLRIAWRILDMLLELIIRPITQVSLSIFTSFRGDVRKIGESYIKISEMTALISFPAFIGMGLIAPQLIILVFGSQWDASIVPLQISTLMVFALPLIYFKSNALFSVGKSRVVLYLNIFELALSVLVCLFAVQYGLVGAAIGNVVRFFLVTPVIGMALKRYVECDWRKIILRTLPIMHATIWMVVITAGLGYFMQGNVAPVLIMLATSVTGAVIYIATMLLFHRKYVRDLWQSSGAQDNKKIQGAIRSVRRLLRLSDPV